MLVIGRRAAATCAGVGAGMARRRCRAAAADGPNDDWMTYAPSTAHEGDQGFALPDPVPPPAAGTFDAVFLGTGVSTAIPCIAHVLRGTCGPGTRRRADGVSPCADAHRDPESKNRRNNVSLLLRYSPPGGGAVRNVMVDCGKTMRDGCLRIMPRYGVTAVNAVLITHAHADAMLGLDNLRDLQVIEAVKDERGEPIGYRPAGDCGPVSITSNAETVAQCRQAFPYLKSLEDMGAGEAIRPGIARRRVACVEWKVVGDWAQLRGDADGSAGLPTQVFPVYHGGDYVSLGFGFGGSAPLVYISDIDRCPADTMEWLRAAAPRIDTLVVDALSIRPHTTHFCLKQAVDFARAVRPAGRTLLVGMNSCQVGDHDEVNARLAELREREGLDIELAFDGQHIGPFPSAAAAARARRA